MNICPICGGDRDENVDDLRDTMGRICAYEDLGPGGRLFVLKNGLEIRISEQCRACDRKVIESALRGGPVIQFLRGLYQKIRRLRVTWD